MVRRKGRSRPTAQGVVVLVVLVLVVVVACGGHSAVAFLVAVGHDNCRSQCGAEPAFLLKAEAVSRSSGGDYDYDGVRPSKRNTSSFFPKSSSGRASAKRISTSSSSSSSSQSQSQSQSSLKFRDMQDMLERLSNPNETLLIVFTAANCGPCKLQSKELSEFRQRLTNEMVGPTEEEEGTEAVPLRMLAIDTAKWPHVGLTWFKVSKLPCVVVLRDKRVVARMEGLTMAGDLLEHVRPHLHPPRPLP